MKRVFIDGSAGTTGLRIRERLEGRKDLELIRLTEENRKDPEARREALALRWPGDAAAESAAMTVRTAVMLLCEP